MKNYLKKAAICAVATTLAAVSMTGCSKNIDGNKTVSTVNDEDIKLGTVNFMLRYQQAQTAQMYEMYFGGSAGIWSQVADEESGETYGEQTLSDVMEQMEDMVILRQHAADYDVTVSDEEKEKIEKAAEKFIKANDEETLTYLGVNQDMVEEVLELSYYKEKMYDPITAEADTEVSDDEAAQTGVTFVKVADSEEEQDDSEETKTDAKTTAQQVLDEVMATADADMDAIAKGVDEDLSATTTHFATSSSAEEEDSTAVPQEVRDIVKNLTDGEVASNLVEADGAYYVVRLDAAFDKDATEDEKKMIINDRQQDLYDETTGKWREDSEITQNKKVLKTLKVTDNDKYSFKQADTDETEDDAAAEEETVSDGTAE
ncbi:MAG: hypothetical protein Q4F24_07355 [Eubacteriales bacterium]|nr:hypothetical protein [Eubacteriales bacterium]